MSIRRIPGRAAWRRNGWWIAHRFLILRRLAQAGFLLVFLSGPWFGVWIAKGTLASSLTFDALPLTDPFILLQSLVARHWPEMTAVVGALIVLGAYLVLGGRTFCSWVCPINPVADFAGWTRRRLELDRGWIMKREVRWFVLAMTLVVSALTGTVAWELINPVTAVYRAALFGALFGLIGAAAVFVFDLVIARDGWCGHLCPVGAAYGLIGKAALLRVSARGREACDDCLDCYAACPENHVISPALRGSKSGAGPVILSGDCTVCGRCIDVCPQSVFTLTHRFDRRLDPPAASPIREERPARAAA